MSVGLNNKQKVKTMKTYQVIARTLGAMRRCEKSGNTEWADRHQAITEARADVINAR